MLDYKLNEKTRAKMAREHKAVQAAISVIANECFGKTVPPDGIGKYEGGVKVNGREICIRKNNVMDDWKRTTTYSTPEEHAVVKAIAVVADMVDRYGVKAVKVYGTCQGDPLRSMFSDYKID